MPATHLAPPQSSLKDRQIAVDFHPSTKHWLLFHWAKYCCKCQTPQGSLRLQSTSPQKHIFWKKNPKPFCSNVIYKRNEHILKSEYGDVFLDPQGGSCVCYEWKFPRFVAHNSASEQSVWRHLKSLLRECQGCTQQLSWKNAQEGENKNNRSAIPTVLSALDSFMWKIKSCLCKCFAFQVSPLRLWERTYFCYLKQSMSFSTF